MATKFLQSKIRQKDVLLSEKGFWMSVAIY